MASTWSNSAMSSSLPLVAAIILTGAVLQAVALSPNGTNVCGRPCQRSFKERVQSYKRCGLFGWRRCAHYTYQLVVHNETCYECCPGWMQSDDGNCNTQEPCPSGSAGIRSCIDLPDGNYQSCGHCHSYSACAAGKLLSHQPCCCGLVWDDELKRCEWKSKTCHLPVKTTPTPTVTTEALTTPHHQLTTPDPDGINCGPGLGRCWVRYDFRYDDNWNDCHGDRYVRRSGHPFAKYVGATLCSQERYKLFLGDHLRGVFQNIADGNGDCRDHCEFVGGKECAKGVRVATGFWKAPLVYGFYRDEWGEEPRYGPIGRGWFPDSPQEGSKTDTGRVYVQWYQCGVNIPGNNSVIDVRDTILGSEWSLQADNPSWDMPAAVTSHSTSPPTVRSQPTEDVTLSSTTQTSFPRSTPTHKATTTQILRRIERVESPPKAMRQLHIDVEPEGSGSGRGSGTGSTGPTCDVISCPEPSVCVDLYGDDEDEPFSKCVCPPGMATLSTDPSTCVEVDECDSSPCLHGGQCLDRRGGYVCDCAPGFQGSHCEVVEFFDSQRPLCNHCTDYRRLSGSCSGRYCECRKGRYNTYTCLPEVSDCTILRNQSNARGRPEKMIDKPNGVVYSCVPSEKPRPQQEVTPPPAQVRQHPLYEVHGLAIFRSTKGSVVVNVTWSDTEDEENNLIPNYHSYVMLALSNYWPTSWTVVIPPWRQLSEVIVFSHAHRNTTVTVRRGSATGGLVPVNTFHLHPASYPPGFGDDTHAETNTPSMLEYLYNQYGSLASFTGTYQADQWQLTVGQRPQKHSSS